jgi:hypothetical protein
LWDRAKQPRRGIDLKKNIGVVLLFILLCTLLTCFGVGNKAASASIIYAATAVLSLATAAGYRILIRKRDPWFVLLFSSVLVVNTGYLTLSLSGTLNAALWANRLSYLGSVFLPLSMLMIILEATDLKYKKWLPVILFALSAAIFFITASPGYLDIYYKQVSIATINGVTVLQKVYGPWHSIYLFYLMGYFATMIVAIAYSHSIKRTNSLAHSLVMLTAVFVNIAVWL